MNATSADRLSSSLTTISALLLAIAVPALICVAYVLLAFVFEWFAVCFSGHIFEFCMTSWSFPFSDQRILSFQSDLKTILVLFSFTAAFAVAQCCLTALPLAYYLSQGVAKDARRGWRFFTIVGGLVAISPWAVIVIVNGYSGRPEPALFLLFAIGAVAGLCMKWLLLRKASRKNRES
jgi:ABC-type spermidine/putrescine transport system permease subunit I